MEPVSRLNKLLEVLRQKQTATQSSKTTSSAKSKTTEKGRTTQTSPTSSREIGELKSVLVSRLKSLSSEDLNSSKAHTVFFESVLTWEFGTNLLNDQNFSAMIDNLKDAMTHDPKLKKMIDTTLRELANN